MQSSNSQRIDLALSEAQSVRNMTSEFKQQKKGKFYTLSTLKYKDHPIKLVAIIGNAPVNFEKAVKFYSLNVEQLLKNRDMLESQTLIENIDENNLIKVVKIKSKLVVSAREILQHQQVRQINANEVAIINANVESHPKVPENKNAVRAEGIMFTIFLTKISESETKVEAFMLTDPKGNIPNALINSMVEQQLDAFEKDVNDIQKL